MNRNTKAILMINLAASSLFTFKNTAESKITNNNFYNPEIIIRLPDELVKAPREETPVECLQKNIFLEAAYEGEEGMTAVANVVMNRVQSQKYPRSVCGVVYQAEYQNGQIVKHRCQFSWYCDGKADMPPINKHNRSYWKKAGEIARLAVNNQLPDIVDGATHYHATWLEQYPQWKLEPIAVIGNHIFYREL